MPCCRKESALALQSALRRRHDREIGITSQVKDNLASRKVVKNAIHKVRELEGAKGITAFVDGQTLQTMKA
ncbi:hypothetical protein HS088_TW22G00811 [Tripterygium wilfordii]|uniref:Uncharacterized protein n=1 Tax=Tripterygium wilfordii TaxID=458696 RepID=A0A7J7BZ27_TRIWF|nr:hypothetical protein HS088_TW22G00811 [Tripterygium wilfordii]